MRATKDDIAASAARTLQALRKTKSGGRKGGRKRTDAPRCPCGLMTAKLAEIRNHKCTSQATRDKANSPFG